MAPAALQAVVDSISSRMRGRTTYHRTRGTDATELLVVAPLSNGSATIDSSSMNSISDPENENPATFHIPKWVQDFRQRFTGWRRGALGFATGASIVFLINFVVTVWGLASYNSNQGILSKGNCDRIKHLNTGLHVMINVFSTIILSGSNYCMQCLSAPTRRDIDQAHAEGKWLDVGIPSFRNLTRISFKRSFLWFLLGISSLPLHLL